MKKLNKIQINSEKLMKDDELVMIRGGYQNCCQCYTIHDDLNNTAQFM